ncbi:MAG: acetyl-CoA carboxylase, biotin carboxyl carrier protein [Alphaproteobacteria bacterium]|nr:MAG: acetyl-CoA carboxylase, biotin carboxyl carrier protein [Alphaproteobacteria bacterium]
MGKFDVDESLVRKLAELLQETGLNEIEYENGTERIRVNRGTATFAAAPAAHAAPAAPNAGPAPQAASDQPPSGAVTSPMVGTAYLAPEPGAASFVKVGDRIAKGQTLLIIEAMKVMNPIAAPHAGTVVDILVQDGRPVEYGEVLMVVQ